MSTSNHNKQHVRIGNQLRHACCDVAIDDLRMVVTSRQADRAIVGMYAVREVTRSGWIVEDGDGSSQPVALLNPG